MRVSKLSDRGKKFFVIILIIGLIVCIFTANTDNYQKIIDASVDAENGNIAYAYSDPAHGNLIIKSYDSNGTELFANTYHMRHGSVYLRYDREKLYVYVDGHSDLLVFDNNGNEIDESADDEWIKELARKEWAGWEKKNGNLCFAAGENEYIYRKNSFWKAIVGNGGCKLSIFNVSGEEIPIYQSGKI